MKESVNFEELLASARGREVRLRRDEVQELAQKLRARGGTEAAAELETLLSDGEDVALAPEQAQQLLEELRASGRRWVGGAARRAPVAAPQPGPKQRLLRRFWRR